MQTLSSILVTIQYLYGRWRQTQTSTDSDLSNSAKLPEQAAIPQSHAPTSPNDQLSPSTAVTGKGHSNPVKLTEQATMASQSHRAAPTSRSAPSSLSSPNGLPPSTIVASGGLSILVKPLEQASSTAAAGSGLLVKLSEQGAALPHRQLPLPATVAPTGRYPHYVPPLLLPDPPPPALYPTQRGRGPPYNPPLSLPTTFLVPINLESLQWSPWNQFSYFGITPLHFIRNRATGRDFTLTAFFGLSLDRALRQYFLNIAIAHIQVEFPLGMINEDWKSMLYKRP
jgi:hypothetical protein